MCHRLFRQQPLNLRSSLDRSAFRFIYKRHSGGISLPSAFILTVIANVLYQSEELDIAGLYLLLMTHRIRGLHLLSVSTISPHLLTLFFLFYFSLTALGTAAFLENVNVTNFLLPHSLGVCA